MYTFRIAFWLNGTCFRFRTFFSQMQPNGTGQWYYAEYGIFFLDSESKNYALHLTGFSGSVIHSPTQTSPGRHDGMSFTTFDVDNDKCSGNCAHCSKGGWWFHACQHTCLTCKYNSSYFQYRGLREVTPPDGALQAARMMIRSKWSKCRMRIIQCYAQLYKLWLIEILF